MSKERLTAIQSNFSGAIDSTLREGEQFAGAYQNEVLVPHEFSFEESKNILGLLHTIGIEYAEVCNPLAREMDSHICQLTKLQNRPKLLAHIRNNTRDLQAAVACGVEGVNILTTIDSDRLVSMNHTIDSYLSVLNQVIGQAKEANLEVRVGVEHGFERDPEQTLAIYRQAQLQGVDRISIADTRGQLSHWEVADMVIAIRKEISTPIQVHFHNDFQSAVPNSIQALQSGANFVDTTILGIGERTGITPMSSLLSRLHSMGIDTGYQIDQITNADSYVANIIGVTVPFNVITAPNAFTHRAGIHINSIQHQGTSLYEPISASSVGNTTNFVTGTRISGKTTQTQAQNFLGGLK